MPIDLRSFELEMPENLRALFAGDPFDAVMQLQGEIYRDVPGRKTIQANLGGQSYFIKQHFGVGWAEVLKNLASLRLPIFSARTEWQAIRRFGEIGIPTTPAVAYGRVFVGNTDGWMYAYGAKSGNLLWAKQAGSYVYTAAAVAESDARADADVPGPGGCIRRHQWEWEYKWERWD